MTNVEGAKGPNEFVPITEGVEKPTEQEKEVNGIFQKAHAADSFDDRIQFLESTLKQIQTSELDVFGKIEVIEGLWESVLDTNIQFPDRTEMIQFVDSLSSYAASLGVESPTNTSPMATPPIPTKSVPLTPPEICKEIGLSNDLSKNKLFFRRLFDEYASGNKPNVGNYLYQLAKREGLDNSNSFNIKSDLDVFLKRVFSDSSKDAKKLINQLYLYADLIDSKEMFDAIKGKIKAKIPEDSPELHAFLDKLHFEDSPQERMLTSIFEDPEFSTSLVQFDKDFERSSFIVKNGDAPVESHITKEEFVSLVASMFPDKKMQTQFLNFFQQAAKSYSLNRFLEHPAVGEYPIKDGSFFLVKNGDKIQFGFYQTGIERKSGKALTHHLESTFRSEGITLIDRLESSYEYFSPLPSINI